MRVYYDICEMLERELEDITRGGELNPKDLEIMDKSVDIIKDIETIKAMRGSSYASGGGQSNAGGSYAGGRSNEGGYSNRYPMYFDDGYTMARGGGRGGRSNRGGYSRNDDMEMLEDKLEELKQQLNQMK